MKPTPTTLKPLALGMLAITAILGGTDIASAQTITLAPEGGSNVGGANDHYQMSSVDPWVDGIVDTLSEQRMIAIQNFADGNMLMGIHQLKQGLTTVIETASNPASRLSWTYKMAERTLKLADRLQAVSNPSDDKQMLPVWHVLESSYQLIEKYYYSLDVQFYTPYHVYCTTRSGRINYDVNQFETIMTQYALKQVSWFQKSFVMNTSEIGTVPRYSAKVFLLTLASVAQGLSSDLSADASNTNPSLFPLAHAQAARSLAKLARDIENHMAGNGIFGNDQRAVNFTYTRLTQIVSNIQSLGR